MGGWVAERTSAQDSGETSRLSGSAARPALWRSCSRLSVTTLACSPKASPGSSPAARPSASLSSAGEEEAEEEAAEADDGDEEAPASSVAPSPPLQAVSSA